MKNLFKTIALPVVLATATFFTSCSNENEGIFDPIEETQYELKVNPDNDGSSERQVEATSLPGGSVTVNVNFKGDKTMRRLYMTKNGEPYEYPLGSKKPDGSINLDGEDKTEFTFQFVLDGPENTDEAVQYVLWTTNNAGDFRDISDSNAIADDAFGVITIVAGSADASSIGGSVKTFSTVILAAPLADGSSKSFISVFNGQKYVINEGVETAALWDFGYFYTTDEGASFASTNEYMDAFKNNSGEAYVKITDITGLTKSQLNHFYIGKSTLNFDDADASTLSGITQPTTEVVTNLSVEDVLEFVDAYGNKGLIKVTEIEGTYNSGDYIKFDVKVQTVDYLNL